MSMTIEFQEQTAFLDTKAHSRFVEFAEACVQHRYIGVCHGRPGVGKTRSAREFAQWPENFTYDLNDEVSVDLEAQVRACRAIFVTARVSNTPNRPLPKSSGAGLKGRVLQDGVRDVIGASNGSAIRSSADLA